MTYILDTDIIIYFLKKHDAVVKQVLNTEIKDISTTIINQTELLFGAFNSTKKKQNLEVIHSFISDIIVLPFCEKSAYVFAEQKATLVTKGNIIADLDLMIASIALANNKILVTNNLKHFERIKHLKIENWYKS